jgi:hypothetical protein
VVAEEGVFDPGKMKVNSLFDAFNQNYRAANQPLLEEPG